MQVPIVSVRQHVLSSENDHMDVYKIWYRIFNQKLPYELPF